MPYPQINKFSTFYDDFMLLKLQFSIKLNHITCDLLRFVAITAITVKMVVVEVTVAVVAVEVVEEELVVILVGDKKYTNTEET